MAIVVNFLFLGEVTIEGVVPPQGMMVQPTQQMEAPSPQQQQVHMPMQHQQHIVTQQQPPSQAQQHIHAQPVRVHCFRSHYFILSTHSLYLYLLCFTLYLCYFPFFLSLPLLSIGCDFAQLSRCVMTCGVV